MYQHFQCFVMSKIKKIEKTQYKALKIVYKSNESYEELLILCHFPSVFLFSKNILLVVQIVHIH